MHPPRPQVEKRPRRRGGRGLRVLGAIAGTLLLLATARVGFEFLATRPESVSLEAPAAVAAGATFGVFVEIRAGDGTPAWPIRLEGRAGSREAVLGEREAILPPGASSVAVRFPLHVGDDGTLHGERGSLAPAPEWSLRAVLDLPGLRDMESESRIVRISRP